MNKIEDDEIVDENLTDGEIKALAERKFCIALPLFFHVCFCNLKESKC